MTIDRINDLQQFYRLMSKLEKKLGGFRYLSECNGRMNWPEKGILFFYEVGEFRFHQGLGNRIVFIGTNAIKKDSETTLWKRLRQHRGRVEPPGGRHRNSALRSHIGDSLMEKIQAFELPRWGMKKNISERDIRQEQDLEALVSNIIGSMPFLWLGVDDEAGANNRRIYIKQNSIALLSNFNRTSLDSSSQNWLGNYSSSEKIRNSGLWNIDDVEREYDQNFLSCLENIIQNI